MNQATDAVEIGAFSLQGQPNIDSAMPGAGAIPISRAGEEAVVAARCGVRVIVSVTLSLVIAPARVAVVIIAVLISMLICTHDLMFIRATFIRAALVRAILCAEERRAKAGHRESRQSK